MKDLYIRYIARIVIEFESSFKIGTGDLGNLVDQTIVKDANNLPYLPGTSLAGVLRSHAEARGMETDCLFGNGIAHKEAGSRLMMSDAVLLATDGITVLEGLQTIDEQHNYYGNFQNLPQRDHVRISDTGTAVDRGKYDEELAPKGVRFVFEMELQGNDVDAADWEHLLNLLHQDDLRIGGGTRKGFGKFSIVECKTISLNLRKDLQAYLSISSALNKDVDDWEDFSPSLSKNTEYRHYRVTLKPNSFFLFGGGMGDAEADEMPKREYYFDWSSGNPIRKEAYLIPATSLKGALSHRTAFHYNALTNVDVTHHDVQLDVYNALDEVQQHPNIVEIHDEIAKITATLEVPTEERDEAWLKRIGELKSKTIDLQGKTTSIERQEQSQLEAWKNYTIALDDYVTKTKQTKLYTGAFNDGVQALFGAAKEADTDGKKGAVLISDVYLDKEAANVHEKLWQHVALDRFTGGARRGALYNEKAITSDAFSFDIWVENKVLEDALVKESFESALQDLTHNRLQLGGQVAKGHGAFTGSFTIENT